MTTRAIDGRIGLVLGSGAARGWAHIGVIRALEKAGIVPTVVCGSSIGAVVAGAYAAGRLDAFEQWVRDLDWRLIVSSFDLSFRGGIIKARRIFELMAEPLPDSDISELNLEFGAVATDLVTGREVWLREGTLYRCLRASAALPGLVQPVAIDDRWLVDGGLVNPVPVSLCRAMGADFVIAVDLNTTLLERRFRRQTSRSADSSGHAAAALVADDDEDGDPAAGVELDDDGSRPGTLQAALQDLMADLRQRLVRDESHDSDAPPSIYEVVMSAINIMQVRIARSRLAGDPADVLVTPRLNDFALLDFDRADEAIAEGERAVEQALAVAVSNPSRPVARVRKRRHRRA